MVDLEVDEIDGGVVFCVKVVPGSSKTASAGVLGAMLKIKVSAPPEKGKANQCLVEFLAKELGVKKNAISIIAGLTSPIKQVRVMGLTAKQLAKSF